MKPSEGARYAAAVTLSKGKMYEYSVPLEHHIRLPDGLDLEEQFPLAVGTLGDFAAETVHARLKFAADGERTSPEDLQFAGRVLQAFVDARVNAALAPELLLLASSAFYLGGRPGDAMVLLKRLQKHPPSPEDDLDIAIRWALDKPWADPPPRSGRTLVAELVRELAWHFLKGDMDNIDLLVSRLHVWAYANGSAHELLLCDILSALVLERIERSAWSLLPRYSTLDIAAWEPYLLRPDSVHEVWPSQQMLGAAGIYAGKSAVVQMPTSAGKTRATELIIRAAILSGRTTLGVVVAPFRALCQEIATALQAAFAPDNYQVNQLSDALQPDYVSELLPFLNDAKTEPHVVVLTPEKLLYVLRQEPALVERIGLIIYDEGHQFDAGSRGVTYELLLTSIKRLLRADAQSVLVSAVIRNAAEVARWLLKSPQRMVADDRPQTHRAIAFINWSPVMAPRLEFNREAGVQQAFFVPRVITTEELARKPRERIRRVFPTRSSGSVALYLALRLVPNGGVAIFCGRKATAAKIVREATEEVFARGVSLLPPAAWSDGSELAKLERLFGANFGADSYLARSAGLGIYAHHGNTPHGLRLAVEHAMRAGFIRLVVCTSTLAQGVNLPIRYLLITSTMQGGDAIKARDFHNLMGRAGRAGMHDEGTVIFTDPDLYGERNRLKGGGKLKWQSMQKLLAPENAEPTGSSLLDMFEPLRNESRNDEIRRPNRFEVVSRLVRDRPTFLAQVAQLSADEKARGFSTGSLMKQLEDKIKVLEAVESFLMTHRENGPSDAFYAKAQALARETLAYSLAEGEATEWLTHIFDGVARRIEGAVPDTDTQARFGRWLLGVDASLDVEKWAEDNYVHMSVGIDEIEMLQMMWPLLVRLAPEPRLRDTEPPESLWQLARGWMEGKPYKDLHAALHSTGACYPHGDGKRKFSIDMVVELCEQTFGFEFSLLLAALSEALSHAAQAQGEQEHLERFMRLLQKRLKYGLPSVGTIAFFEAGFAERVVAQALGQFVGEPFVVSATEVRDQLRRMSGDAADKFFGEYPAYFRSMYDVLLRLN